MGEQLAGRRSSTFRLVGSIEAALPAAGDSNQSWPLSRPAPVYGAALRWKRRSQILPLKKPPSREKVGTTDRQLERDVRRTVGSTMPRTSLWSYSAQDLAAHAIAASHRGLGEEQSGQMSGTRRTETAFTVASSFFHRIRVRKSCDSFGCSALRIVIRVLEGVSPQGANLHRGCVS
jgi:hypothetical protein